MLVHLQSTSWTCSFVTRVSRYCVLQYACHFRQEPFQNTSHSCATSMYRLAIPSPTPLVLAAPVRIALVSLWKRQASSVAQPPLYCHRRGKCQGSLWRFEKPLSGERLLRSSSVNKLRCDKLYVVMTQSNITPATAREQQDSNNSNNQHHCSIWTRWKKDSRTVESLGPRHTRWRAPQCAGAGQAVLLLATEACHGLIQSEIKISYHEAAFGHGGATSPQEPLAICSQQPNPSRTRRRGRSNKLSF